MTHQFPAGASFTLPMIGNPNIEFTGPDARPSLATLFPEGLVIHVSQRQPLRLPAVRVQASAVYLGRSLKAHVYHMIQM